MGARQPPAQLCTPYSRCPAARGKPGLQARILSPSPAKFLLLTPAKGKTLQRLPVPPRVLHAAVLHHTHCLHTARSARRANSARNNVKCGDARNSLRWRMVVEHRYFCLGGARLVRLRLCPALDAAGGAVIGEAIRPTRLRPCGRRTRGPRTGAPAPLLDTIVRGPRRGHGCGSYPPPPSLWA